MIAARGWRRILRKWLPGDSTFTHEVRERLFKPEPKGNRWTPSCRSDRVNWVDRVDRVRSPTGAVEGRVREDQRPIGPDGDGDRTGFRGGRRTGNATGWARTINLRFRRPMLYPIELQSPSRWITSMRGEMIAEGTAGWAEGRHWAKKAPCMSDPRHAKPVTRPPSRESRSGGCRASLLPPPPDAP